MYSVALMMALTGGGEAVGFCHRSACSSAHSCATVACASSCSSCARACHGGLFSRWHSRCNGGCAVSSHGCSSSCHGGCHGGLFSRFRHGCSSACSSSGCSGTVVTEPKSEGKAPEVKKEGKEEASNAAPATIIVSLPADAKLTVDGNPTRSTSARRTFVTPALEIGETYTYTFRAEVVLDGQTSVQTQNVVVRGGQTTEVNFNFAPQGIASR